ncbi:hypothetical protein GCM10010917_13880 [Paenibacillus physcomitrellae]|uniref:YfhD family protein n=1 Tax=Paenibacillus physcomitrellae TaxID=1619311 RepID=A0ABQ1FUH4_9BACL|nr:hypothetical protein GCM10010917_13880 [Paenibacillus physcomitrellae]
MGNAEIDRKHVTDVSQQSTKPHSPSMPEAAADPFIQLSGVDRTNRSRKRQAQKDITNK